MVGNVLVVETVLSVRLQTDVTLKYLEVRNEVSCLSSDLIVFLHYQFVLDGVKVEELNLGETKTAECFEHKVSDKPRDILTASRNSLGQDPPRDRINNSDELQ